jgi:tetratricopeptide (TPR) repeat protein
MGYQGQYDSALTVMEQGLAVAQKAQDRFMTMIAQEGIGTVLLEKEQFPAALDHFEKTLELGTALHDIEHLGYAAVESGTVLWLLGRFSEAHARLDQAETAARGFGSLNRSVTQAGAELALSEGRYREAISTCKRLLSNAKQSELGGPSAVNRVLGLALIRSGRTREGRQLCERSFSVENAATDSSVVVASTLAVAEARLETGDHRGVLSVVQAAASQLGKLPDSNWRAMAMESAASKALGDKDTAKRTALAAQERLDAIAIQWGSAAFQLYHARPDLQRFWRPLLGAVSASH